MLLSAVLILNDALLDIIVADSGRIRKFVWGRGIISGRRPPTSCIRKLGRFLLYVQVIHLFIQVSHY